MSDLELENKHWEKLVSIVDASVRDGETERSFEYIQSHLKKYYANDSQKHDDLTLYINRFTELSRDWALNVISYQDYHILRGKLNQGIIKFSKLLKPAGYSLQIFQVEDTDNNLKPANSTVEQISAEITLSFDFFWNFENNIVCYIQFFNNYDTINMLFAKLNDDPYWSSLIRKEWYYLTESNPLGIKLPEGIIPDIKDYWDEDGFIGIEEKVLVWADAIRFELRDSDNFVLAESIVIKKEQESQIWIRSIGKTNEKCKLITDLMRWFENLIDNRTNFQICLNVAKGIKYTADSNDSNEINISLKQPI